MLETVSKSRFKAKALEYFRKIEQNGQAVIIIDHGKPVLQVLRFDDPLEPVGLDDWDALK
jgi:PHD/YefM family antitoxin component YafN of YafNO toxin-antitoxin module